MNSLATAHAHLAKAREFLDAAGVSLDLEQYNAATSNAVISAINSKDAICLKRLGATMKSDNHADAVKELSAAGKDAARLAPTFKRLLALKAKSQYQSATIAASTAKMAVTNAEKMYEAAREIASS
ncbi:MAG: HEPN domain-containing protein [Acidimicrobiia bacterium]